LGEGGESSEEGKEGKETRRRGEERLSAKMERKRRNG
jgi:hypothetical protein